MGLIRQVSFQVSFSISGPPSSALVPASRTSGEREKREYRKARNGPVRGRFAPAFGGSSFIGVHAGRVAS